MATESNAIEQSILRWRPKFLGRPRRFAESISSDLVLQLVGFALVFRFLWIEDIPFIQDEPQLILKAFRNNALGKWAIQGLQGTQGVHYGPLPSWLLQVAIGWVQTPMQLALCKSIAITGLTLWGLSLWRSGAPVTGKQWVWLVILNPFLLFYARDLWDNSWSIPFSLLFWVSYLRFDGTASALRLLSMAVLGAFLVLVHLSCLPLIAAVGLHLVWTHHVWLRTHWKALALSLAVISALIAPYVASIIPDVLESPDSWSFQGLLFGLSAPRYFTALDMGYFLGRNWEAIPEYAPALRATIQIAVGLSALGIGFFWFGAYRAFESLRSGALREAPTQAADHAGLLAFSLFVLLAFAFGLGVDNFSTGNGQHPHYFNAIWPVIFYFVWRGMHVMWEGSAAFLRTRPSRVAGRAVVVTYALSLAVVLVFSQLRIHIGQGTRSLHYGPTLGNLWAVSEQLEAVYGAEIIPGTIHSRAFPMGLNTLVAWRSLKRSSGQKPRLMHAKPELDKWLITYRNPRETWNGAIALEKVKPAAGTPAKPATKGVEK